MIRIVSPDLDRLAAGAAEFPKVMRSGTRKTLRLVATEGQKASKSKIRGMPVKGDVPYRESPDALRRDIGNAIRISAVVSATSGASVRIYVANTGALAAHNRGRVAELLDSGKPFRHRYWGKWVKGAKSQAPYAYFKSEQVRLAPKMQAGMQTALTEATIATMPNAR